MSSTYKNIRRHSIMRVLRDAHASQFVLLSGLVIAQSLVLKGTYVLNAHFLQEATVHEETTTPKTSVTTQPESNVQKRAAARRSLRLVHQRLRTIKTRDEELLHSAASPMSLLNSQNIVALNDASIPASSFPAFDHTVFPVQIVPNWGDMRTPAEWNRAYSDMRVQDFVPLPPYDLSILTIPFQDLLQTRNDPTTINILTEKLTYSTRYFGRYDLDSNEFEAVHPGIDIKLAEGTPVGSIAGGRVHAVHKQTEGLGTHVIVEHRSPDGQTYYAIYGHLDSASVQAGQTVRPGDQIGKVGVSGTTTGPHLHLQIDRGEPGESSHTVYWPDHLPSGVEADRSTVNPITFITFWLYAK